MASHKKGKSKRVKKASGEGEKKMRDGNELEENRQTKRDEGTEDIGERLTLEDLDAISDEENDEEEHSGEEGEELGNEDNEWDAEARALRQAIAEGAFDSLARLDKSKKEQKKNRKAANLKEEEGGEEVQEVELEDDSEDSDDSDRRSKGQDDKNTRESTISNSKALQAVTNDLYATRDGMPWAESFDVVSPTLLPFGIGGAEGSPLDVHDDLKREVAFYNVALQAVHEARSLCKRASIPFTRPDDFFAEMVKTDDHMAKVKDRLIFETKKMEAFEQRKANKEHKLRAREAQAHRIAEKSKAKKDHLKAVNEWAKNAAANRPSGGMVRDDDDTYLEKLNGKRKGWQDRDGNLQFGPNKKRIAADKKYGFGGKKGRFKQIDRKSLDDMSGYNPRLGGTGGNRGKAGSGANRKGKRARDAARSRS